MPHRSNSWHSSPPLISPPLLIILLPILTLTLLFLTLHPLLSAASNILQNTSLKLKLKPTWNSLNILLVVFAIFFGLFSKRTNDEDNVEGEKSQQQITNDVVPDQNASFQNELVPDQNNVVTGVNRLRIRSSSSYPDLRQIETGDDRYKFRFFDDFEIQKQLQFRSPLRATFHVSDHRKRLPEDCSQQEEDEVHVKEIHVDTFEICNSSPVKSRSPPPPPPPPLPRRHSNQMHHSMVNSSEITESEDLEFTRLESPLHEPPSAAAPRLSAKTRSEQKNGKSGRRKSNVKREIAMVWASVLSNQRKRKKKQKPKNDHNYGYDNVDELTNNTVAPPMMPPPPPPPPPPSVFQSIFRKGLGKNKKIHSMPTPAPPPPSRRSSKNKNQIPPPLVSTPPLPPRRRNHTKPPLPNKSSNFINEMLNAGNQSPMIPIPPPLPPFKMPAMKFVVRGDFVKIRSNQSSRSTSPEREHIEAEVSETTTVTNTVMNHNGDMSESIFCPSPDVNAKAAMFIARLRGEWRLQKLNSIKEKGNASLPLARD